MYLGHNGIWVIVKAEITYLQVQKSQRRVQVVLVEFHFFSINFLKEKPN